MRKSKDPCWVKYVNRNQYSINTSSHSTFTLEYKTPYRILFDREHVQGLGRCLESQMRLLQMSLQKKR